MAHFEEKENDWRDPEERKARKRYAHAQLFSTQDDLAKNLLHADDLWSPEATCCHPKDRVRKREFNPPAGAGHSTRDISFVATCF